MSRAPFVAALVALVATLAAGCPAPPRPQPLGLPVASSRPAEVVAVPPVVIEARVEPLPALPAPTVTLVFGLGVEPPALADVELPHQARACAQEWTLQREREREQHRAHGYAVAANDRKAGEAARLRAEGAGRKRRKAVRRCLEAFDAHAPSAAGRLVHALMLVERSEEPDQVSGMFDDGPTAEQLRDRARAAVEAAACEQGAAGTPIATACARVLAYTADDPSVAAAALRRALPGLDGAAADTVRVQLAAQLVADDPDEAARLVAPVTAEDAVGPAAWLDAAAGWRRGDCDAVWRAGAACRAAARCDVAAEIAHHQAVCLADPAAGADRATRLPALDPGATVDAAAVEALAPSFAVAGDPATRLPAAVATCARDRRAGASAAEVAFVLGGTTHAPVLTAAAGAPPWVARVAVCAAARHAATPVDGAPRPLAGSIALAP